MATKLSYKPRLFPCEEVCLGLLGMTLKAVIVETAGRSVTRNYDILPKFYSGFGIARVDDIRVIDMVNAIFAGIGGGPDTANFC
jgi:hypothetical protein